MTLTFCHDRLLASLWDIFPYPSPVFTSLGFEWERFRPVPPHQRGFVVDQNCERGSGIWRFDLYRMRAWCSDLVPRREFGGPGFFVAKRKAGNTPGSSTGDIVNSATYVQIVYGHDSFIRYVEDSAHRIPSAQ